MKNKIPLVSVIIPAYNSIYIRETLYSVSKQTYPNIETIVVDDGSSDQTPEILKEFSNIVVVRQMNKGVSSARNAGLRICRGEFISFIDSDDIWIREKTKKQLAFLSDNKEYDMVFGRFVNYFEEGKDPPIGINREKFLDPDVGKMKHLGTLMARKKIISKVGTFDENLFTGEDLDWFIKIKESGIKSYFDDFIVMKRRLHDNNLSYNSISDKKHLIELFKASLDRKRKT